PAIVQKLESQARRFEELTEQISRPEVASDGKRLPALLQERGRLQSAAELAQRLRSLVARRMEAEHIVADPAGDAELWPLAREDRAARADEERAPDAEIKGALIPEPEDLRRKVIVEIRAGTGGDGATLFPADLYRIYRRYVESKRWKIEDLDVSHTDVG